MDMDQLELELNNMMKAEDLYWLRNDAKIRAAKQHVSYDEFQKIVKTSHLRPLEKGDQLDVKKDKKTLWNTLSKPNMDNEIVRVCSDEIDETKVENFPAKTPPKLNSSKKRKGKGPVTSEEISRLIGKLMEETEWAKEENVKSSLQELIQLTIRPRFDLEWSLANENQRKAALDLVEKIALHLNDDLLQVKSRMPNEH